MSWSEIKKKKEEEEKKNKSAKTSSSNVSKVANTLTGNLWKNIGQNIITSQRNAEIRKQKEQQEQKRTSSVQSMPTTYKRTLEPTVTRTMSQGNNASFVKQSDLKNQKLETVQENTTWGNIVNFVKNTGRTLENIKTGAYTNLIGLSQTAIRDISDVDKAYSEGKSAIRNTLLPLLGDKGKQVNNYLNEQEEKNYAKRNEALNSGLQVLSKEKQKANEDIQRNVLGAKLTDSSVATKMAEIAPSIGQQIPGFAFNAISPVASLLYFKGSAEANYYDDAISRGMDEKQAKIYSKLMSYVEAGTEQLSVGNISKGGKTITTALKGAKEEGLKKGLKAGFDVFKETAKEETANTLKSAFKDYGIGVAEEAFQEAITEPIQEFTAMKVAGEDKADWNNMWQRMLQSGFDGALSSAILAGANLGISSCQGIVTKIENGQNFTTEEYNTAIKDASQKIDIEKLTTDQIKEKVNLLKGELQQPQVGVNENVDQEIKTSQNGFSQAEKTEALRQEARNKLESIKQNYDENSYNQMQEFIETAPNEKALNQVINDLNKEAETKQVAPLKQKQEVQLPMKQETQNKSFEEVAFEAMNNYESNEVESPLKNRDMDSIGKQTKVNAYQYDNPKVKPYFQEMAQQMGEDLAYISSSDNRSTQKGGGTKLSTTTKAMDILHNEQGYSYDQIAKGLQNIIDDRGSENNAISKKIELVIDEQLRNGYNNAFGKYVEPNQEYINTIQGNKDVQLPMKQKQEVSLPLNENVVNNQENSQEQNQTISKDTNKVMDEVQNYIKNNDLDMTTDEFVEWASNVELENEENMTQEQKELYSLISDIQNRTSGMYNENNVDFDKNTYLDYNNKEKNITDSMLSAYSVDNRVEEYFKYNHTDKFYNLTYEEMEKASSVVSDRISENNNGVANDDKYIYYYNAENNDAKNYTITDILEIKEGREEIANERNIDRNSRRSISKGIRQNSSIGDNQSTRYSTTSEKNTSMDSKQSSSESEGNNKKSIRNKQNIENSKESSFSIVDNQGRQLSKQQQEFFKDSKVRNDKGELLEVYHGTKTDGINIFKYNPNKQTGTDYGKAFYFTSDYTKAQGYQYDIENDALYKEYDRKDKEYKNWVFEEGISEDERSNRIKEWSKWHENNNVFDILNNEEFTPERMPKGETKKVYLNLTNPYIANANGEYYSKVYDKYFKEARENGNDGIIVKNVIDVARGEHRPIDVYIAFNENQIKNIDNKAPTDNLDIRYELEDHSDNTAENEIQRKINRSMTMKEAEDMIQRAFVTGNIYDWYDGKYKNGNEWLQGEGAEDVSMWIENDYNLQNKYINSNEDILNEEYTIDDVIEAYQNNALTGNEEKQTQRLDTSKDTGYKDNRFFAPKEVTGGKELYDLASQRVTNKNRSEVYKARADFIINAHNEGYIDNLGLSQKEVNEALRKWTNYPLKARNISGYINQGVATENKWVGIENSSIVNEISVSSEQLDSLVKEVKGTSNEYQRRYIVNTMLALDTHLDYKGLTYDFAPNVEKMRESALADYSPETDTIRVRREGLNTIAHETGHYIDQLLGREIGDGYNLGITTLCRTNFSKELTTQQKQFLNNFSNFLTSIEDVSDIGSTYKMSSNEVFARFVARFVEWTRNTATGNRYGYEADWYKDNFTQTQYVEFAKLLQEYSLLKTTNQVSDKIIRGNKNVYDQRIEDIYAELNKKKKQEVKAPISQEVKQQNEEVNPYRNTGKANKLIKEKNAKINQLKADLDKVSSEVARNSIQEQINNIEKDYNDRIQELYNELPYRTSEEIAKDESLSDLEAIKEESEKVNTPELETAIEKQNELQKKYDAEKSPTIDFIKKKRSKERTSLGKIKDTLAQKIVNKGHYIDKLANKTGNKKLTWLYDRALNSFSEASVSIGENQVNSKGEVVGKSIIDIFEPAEKAKLSAEFEDYLLNKHNISRFAHEKGIFGKEISSTDSQKIVDNYEKSHPEFKEWSKEVSKYNDNNLKDLVNSGLVSQETYNKLREMYGDYVPTYRDITDNLSQYLDDDSVGGNTLRRATESNKDILSVRESMAEQTLAIKKAIRMNNLGVELFNTLNPSKSDILLDGINYDGNAILTLGGDIISKAKGGNNTFTIFQDGDMTTFKISDELYSAFEKDTLQNRINNDEVARAILSPVAKLTQAQRNLLTTYNIGFAMSNPFKDFFDGLFNTKYSSARFLKNYTKALYNIGTNGSFYQSYKNNGATGNTYFDYNKGILPTKTKNPIKKFANGVKAINEVIETAPRLAEYISTIENGGSIDEALYNSAEITVNFKRGGDVTKTVNKYGANFLNASIQGLDKAYRNLTGQNGWKGYASLLTKATLFQIAPALLNGILLGDDDDYEDLPEYTKDNYFLFKMGNGKFFRIPKGRVQSVVGGIARRALETAQGKDVDWSSLVETTINQLSPNNPLEDNILAPLIQASTGKTWYGGDIESSRLQKLPVAERSDEKTDKLSKFLGEKLNISPKKINYVLDQYSGGIGDVVLPMLTPQAESNIFEDKLTTDSVLKNKNVSKFYSLLEDVEKSKNSSKATDEDKLRYKYLSSASTEAGKLYSQKREIENSNLSDKEKREQVREVQKQINNILENALTESGKISVKNDSAKIGDQEYYKKNGSWTKLTEKEKNKLNGTSTSVYSDYQKSTSNLSDTEKIQKLRNSNYSKTDKSNLYEKTISTDKYYSTLKKSGIDIDEYMDYKLAQNNGKFLADRKNGEVVTGSGKKKVIDYLNKNITGYGNRLLIAGKNYVLTDKQRKDLSDYINKTYSTQTERTKVYEQLKKNFVVNGNKVTYK